MPKKPPFRERVEREPGNPRQVIQEPHTDSRTAVALIGMAGHFPGAPSIERYWNLIAGGQEAVTEFSEQELLDSGVPSELLRQPNYVKAAPIAQGMDLFDAPFYRLSARDATATDPQHRVLWQCAWEALERSGYPPDAITDCVGVFAACSMNLYLLEAVRVKPGFVDSLGPLQTLISSDKDFLATGLSYQLNLHGPAYTVQTACSSSLVAVHLACQSLLNYECDMALAGGSTVRVPQRSGYLYVEGSILSRDGHCRPFDAAATGTLFGEGVGVVVLKRLQEAVADRDIIHAVILGSAVNNDGNRKAGFTAPSVEGQRECVAAAQAMAQVDPNTIGYVECHGTGTPLGDPIEIKALAEAFRAADWTERHCAIGSVKANIGHLDAAAGIAGLVKAVLCLMHRQIPPCANFANENPTLALSQSPFFVPTALREWGVTSTDPATPRRAGVSSFGVGGTNAHVVLEEYHGVHTRDAGARSVNLVPVSAKSPEALSRAVSNLSTFLAESPESDLADVAYTLSVGRSHMRHRHAVVCGSTAGQAAAALGGDFKAGLVQTPGLELVFMFPGQGAQYVGMFGEVYAHEPVFRREIDECSALLLPVLDMDLRDIVTDSGASNQLESVLNQTRIAQPAIFVVEYALARLLQGWGLQPSLVVGHSLGEYVAACIAGVFDRDSALLLVASRGAEMQRMPPGDMLVVEATPEATVTVQNQDLDLALFNAPQSCVLAGPEQAIAAAEAACTERGIRWKRLHTSHAFHSRMMDQAVDPFRSEVRRHQLHPPSIPLVSGLTGRVLSAGEATDPDHWGRQLRNAVQFRTCMDTVRDRSRIYLEVGPGSSLRTLGARNGLAGADCVGFCRHASDRQGDLEALYNGVAACWCKGVSVDWRAFYGHDERYRVVLPTYPFQQRRYWVDAQSRAASPDSDTVAVDLPPGKAKAEPVDVRSVLANVWCDMLGLGEADDDDDFFELGGHSLLAAQLFATIGKRLGVSPPLSVLYEGATFGALVRRLRELSVVDGPWPSLVALRQGGNRPALFLVHGAEGNVLLYRELARALPADLPLYALQSQGLDARSAPIETIVGMAERYVAEIRAQRLPGPYLLCGYCMGGAIALEMARIFEREGSSVAMVAMIETYNPTFYAGRRSRLLGLVFAAQNLYYHFRNVMAGGWGKFVKGKAAIEANRLRLMFADATSRLRFGQKERLAPLPHRAITRANDAAFLAYRPEPYDGVITVFRPVKSFYGYGEHACGWATVPSLGVEVNVIGAYPRGMLVAPFVDYLAARLDAVMLAALERESRPEAMATTT